MSHMSKEAITASVSIYSTSSELCKNEKIFVITTFLSESYGAALEEVTTFRISVWKTQLTRNSSNRGGNIERTVTLNQARCETCNFNLFYKNKSKTVKIILPTKMNKTNH